MGASFDQLRAVGGTCSTLNSCGYRMLSRCLQCCARMLCPILCMHQATLMDMEVVSVSRVSRVLSKQPVLALDTLSEVSSLEARGISWLFAYPLRAENKEEKKCSHRSPPFSIFLWSLCLFARSELPRGTPTASLLGGTISPPSQKKNNNTQMSSDRTHARRAQTMGLVTRPRVQTTFTLFLTVSRAFISSTPPHTRRVMRPT